MLRTFRYVKTLAFRLRHDNRAVTALEYGLIASVVVGTVVVGFQHLGGSLSTMFYSIGDSL